MVWEEAAFEAEAGAILARWLEILENADLEEVEAELSNGILTIETARGVFVVNKHAPLKQLWLSSPLSGAHHYNYDSVAKLWRNTRSDDDLQKTLQVELRQITGSTELAL